MWEKASDKYDNSDVRIHCSWLILSPQVRKQILTSFPKKWIFKETPCFRPSPRTQQVEGLCVQNLFFRCFSLSLSWRQHDVADQLHTLFFNEKGDLKKNEGSPRPATRPTSTTTTTADIMPHTHTRAKSRGIMILAKNKVHYYLFW